MRWAILITHVLRIAHLRIALHVANPEVGNREVHLFGPSWLPTGVKGAAHQMLPWKAPNDPKTLPMGRLHDYKSCWTTLGPFGVMQGYFGS